MSESVLQVDGLRVTYATKRRRFEALHDVDLELRAGEILGVVGESGCGKSTLAVAMMRLLPANGHISAGTVKLGGRDILSLADTELRSLRGHGIGVVFQDAFTSLNPTFRISTQLVNAQRAHAAEPLGSPVLLRRAVQMLERVGIAHAADRIDDYPHQFSGGMRQRIMLAAVLLLKPTVLICDEVTSSLDVTLQAQILQMLRVLCKEDDIAVLVISHDIGVISSTCDRVTVLYAGRVIETGPTDDVLTRPQHPYTRALVAAVPSRGNRTEPLRTIPGQVPNLSALPSGCTFAPRCEAAQTRCGDDEPELTDVKGQQVRCLLDVRDRARTAVPDAHASEGASGEEPKPSEDSDGIEPSVDEVLLTVRNLRIRFGERRGVAGKALRRHSNVVHAVDGVDLDLKRGEIVGLVGESGSGKTTLGKSLLNISSSAPDGTVMFDGETVLGCGPREWRKLRPRIQMIFQETYGSLSPRLRVEQLVTEPYKINKTPRECRSSAAHLLSMVGLAHEQAIKYPHELSGGQARRVGIARALALQPDFIVADEPTSGLDISAAGSVLNVLQDLRGRLALTLLIISHDLTMLCHVADRIGVMHRGRIVEIGTTSEIVDSPQHAYTKALLASIPNLPGENLKPGDTPRVPGANTSPGSAIDR